MSWQPEYSSGTNASPGNFIVNANGTISEVRTSDNTNPKGWTFGMEFPNPDEMLDKIDAFDRAREVLGEDHLMPPDAIRVLADERAKQLGVEVGFTREVVDGRLEWRVTVKTKRGKVSAQPSLNENESVQLDDSFLPISAWKNALREVGLL